MKRPLILLIGFLFSLTAAAQDGGSAQDGVPRTLLTGIVYDTTGAVITNGKINAYALDGREYATATNDEGVYKFELPLNMYRIDVSSPGFCIGRVERFRIIKSGHGKMSLDFVLEVPSSKGRCRHELIRESRPERRTRKIPYLIVEEVTRKIDVRTNG